MRGRQCKEATAGGPPGVCRFDWFLRHSTATSCCPGFSSGQHLDVSVFGKHARKNWLCPSPPVALRSPYPNYSDYHQRCAGIAHTGLSFITLAWCLPDRIFIFQPAALQANAAQPNWRFLTVVIAANTNWCHRSSAIYRYSRLCGGRNRRQRVRSVLLSKHSLPVWWWVRDQYARLMS